MRPIFARDGIAIGPILFIIALLAIVAIAMSAGSSGFSGNTTNESNRTKAAELIQMGQNYKAAVTRLGAQGYQPAVAGGSMTANNDPRLIVYYDCDGNGPGAGKNCLFSPLGGGGVFPPGTLAADISAPFVYNSTNPRPVGTVQVDGLGSADGDVVFMYVVTQGVCEAARSILKQTNPIAEFTLADDPIDFVTVDNAATHPITDSARMEGCFHENDNFNAYVYYQVLAVR
jgi:hypothetical protein